MFVEDPSDYSYDRKTLYAITMHELGWSRCRAIEKGFGYHPGAYDASMVEKVRAAILTLPYDIRFALLERLEFKFTFFLDNNYPLPDLVDFFESKLDLFGLDQPAPAPSIDPLSDLRPPVNYLNSVLGN